MPNFSPTTLFLLELAEKAAKVLRKEFHPAGMIAKEKADGSAITAVDMAINQIVLDEVLLHYPDHEVLGEELSGDTAKSSKLFVVDPIDGTRMFAMGCPIFNFSIAEVVDGTPVAGVIKNPMAGRTLVAEKGMGAWFLEGEKRLAVSSISELSESFIETASRQHIKLQTLFQHSAKFLDLRASAEASSLVATGGITATIYFGSGTHDIAAAKVIVEEAGGKVTDREGLEQRYDRPINGAIVSNGLIHDQLVDIVKVAKQ